MGLWARLETNGPRPPASPPRSKRSCASISTWTSRTGRDRRAARLRLGNPRRIEEDTRAVGIVEWLESAVQDARYGLRQMRRTPSAGAGGRAVARHRQRREYRDLQLDRRRAAEAAAGEGPRCAGHRRVDEPGDFRRRPSSTITTASSDPSPRGGNQGSSIPAFLYRRIAREQTAFESLIGVGAYPEGVAVAAEGAPAEQMAVQYVSANFFQGLGVQPTVGRPFRDDEDRLAPSPSSS